MNRFVIWSCVVSFAAFGALLSGCGDDSGGTAGAGGNTTATGTGGAGTGGAGTGGTGTGGTGTGGSGAMTAEAMIAPVSGSNITGTATFTASNGQVTLSVSVAGATPGDHGIHLHETGHCGDDAMHAGGHWNPAMKNHGKIGVGDDFHLGDLGNITVGQDGAGTLTFTTDLWTVGGGGMNDVVGRAILLHSGPDDLMSQPSGNSGDRVACGVIAAQMP